MRLVHRLFLTLLTLDPAQRRRWPAGYLAIRHWIGRALYARTTEGATFCRRRVAWEPADSAWRAAAIAERDIDDFVALG